MASILIIQEVLAADRQVRMPAYQLAARAGITTREFNQRVSKWMKHGHLSREKIAGKGYCYYLNGQQLQAYRVTKALSPWARIALRTSAEQAIENDFENFGLVTDAAEVPARLAFLRMLKEKTVFADHATLALIIEDYERTVRLRRAAECRVEMEEKRGRQPSVMQIGGRA